jgi:hypothetical protein
MKIEMTTPVPFRFLIILLGILIATGCGSSIEGEKIAEPPPFETAKGIAFAPFITDEESAIIGKWVPIRLATNFELKFKNEDKMIEWIYDRSEVLNPVASKLQEMGVTLTHIFEDAALAAKLGRELNADLIVLGKVDSPKFKRTQYDKPVKRLGKQAGISGSATYIRVRLAANTRTWVKVIDTKSGQLVFNDSIGGYIKYWYAFQTQQRAQVIFKTDSDMMADLGKHVSKRIAYTLDPTGMPEEEEGVILLKPEIALLGSQGAIKFE